MSERVRYGKAQRHESRQGLGPEPEPGQGSRDGRKRKRESRVGEAWLLQQQQQQQQQQKQQLLQQLQQQRQQRTCSVRRSPVDGSTAMSTKRNNNPRVRGPCHGMPCHANHGARRTAHGALRIGGKENRRRGG